MRIQYTVSEAERQSYDFELFFGTFEKLLRKIKFAVSGQRPEVKVQNVFKSNLDENYSTDHPTPGVQNNALPTNTGDSITYREFRLIKKKLFPKKIFDPELITKVSEQRKATGTGFLESIKSVR